VQAGDAEHGVVNAVAEWATFSVAATWLLLVCPPLERPSRAASAAICVGAGYAVALPSRDHLRPAARFVRRNRPR
jgi:hypothetical protein